MLEAEPASYIAPNHSARRSTPLGVTSKHPLEHAEKHVAVILSDAILVRYLEPRTNADQSGAQQYVSGKFAIRAKVRSRYQKETGSMDSGT